MRKDRKRGIATLVRSFTPLERRVWVRDTLRQGVDGLYTSVQETVMLLVAIQLFGVSDFLRGTIGAAGAMGMILAFFLPAFFRKFSIPIDRCIGVLTLIAGAMIFLAGLAPTGVSYTVAVVIAIACFSLRVPLFARIYNDVYHGKKRARLFNYGSFLLMVVALIGNLLWGRLLDNSLEMRLVIYGIAGTAMMINSLWLFTLERGVGEESTPAKGCLPGRTVEQGNNGKSTTPASPHYNQTISPGYTSLKRDYLYPFSLIWKDRTFGVILGLWFLIGFANLWSLPLRVAYVSDPKYGLDLSPQEVLIIMGIVPMVVRLIFSWVWAHLFDKLNFVVMRILMNIFMGSGIFLFFITDSVEVILLASIIYSISTAGSPIIWNLWVTRVAPPGKIQDYMMVHTGMTGIRGLFGPYLGFWIASSLSVQAVGTISLGLAVVGAIGFLFFLKTPRLQQ